jgi:hypothetical protein
MAVGVARFQLLAAIGRFVAPVVLVAGLAACGGGSDTPMAGSQIAGASPSIVPELQAVKRAERPGMIGQPARVVNTTTAGDQTLQSILALPDGGYAVTWQSGAASFFQRFDAFGARVARETPLSDISAITGQESVKVYADIRFVSSSATSYVESSGIYLRRISAAGAPLGEEIPVAVITENRAFSQDVRNLTSPTTLRLDDGSFVVAWTLTTTNYLGTVREFQLQRFDAEGNPVGGILDIGRGSPEENASFSLMAVPGGEYVVALRKSFQGRPYVVYSISTGGRIGMFFDAQNGLPVADTRLLALSDGRFVLWSRNGSGAYLQIFDHQGVAVGPASPQPSLPYGVVALGDGGYVVFAGPAGSAFLTGQRFDGTGTTVGATFQVETGSASAQYTLLADGDLAFAWTATGPSGDTDVFTQLFEPADTAGKKPQLAIKRACQVQARENGLRGLDRKNFMAQCRAS